MPVLRPANRAETVTCEFVQMFRGKISIVRPEDRTEIGAEFHLPEVRNFLQRLEHQAIKLGLQIDDSLKSIGEPEFDLIVLDVSSISNDPFRRFWFHLCRP